MPCYLVASILGKALMFYSKSVGCYEGHTYDILWWGQDSAGLALVDFTQVYPYRQRHYA